MITITTATNLYYLPRSTMYKVVTHDVKIKTQDGWLLGCVYAKGNETYVRPYDMFDASKWVPH